MYKFQHYLIMREKAVIKGKQDLFKELIFNHLYNNILFKQFNYLFKNYSIN